MEILSKIQLLTREKRLLLKIARETLSHYLHTSKILQYDESMIPDSLLQHLGCFVSIYKGRALRGCIGKFEIDKPLYRSVQDLALSAAIKDERFSPLKLTELSQISLEISILGELEKIDDPKEFIPGKHGILVKKDVRSGTFLPQVAIETGWEREEILGRCARDKAHIGWDGWRDAELYIYESQLISESEI